MHSQEYKTVQFLSCVEIITQYLRAKSILPKCLILHFIYFQKSPKPNDFCSTMFIWVNLIILLRLFVWWNVNCFSFPLKGTWDFQCEIFIVNCFDLNSLIVHFIEMFSANVGVLISVEAEALVVVFKRDGSKTYLQCYKFYSNRNINT